MFKPWEENHFAAGFGPACMSSGGGHCWLRGQPALGGRSSGCGILEDAAFIYYNNYNITTTTNHKGTKTQRTHKEICGGLHLCDPCGATESSTW
jgi:hypothetical protein